MPIPREGPVIADGGIIDEGFPCMEDGDDTLPKTSNNSVVADEVVLAVGLAGLLLALDNLEKSANPLKKKKTKL